MVLIFLIKHDDMPKINKMIGSDGNIFYPITITDGVYDITNNQKLDVTLAGLANTSDVPTVMKASGSGHKGGLVPDPGATAGTSKFLNENGTWLGLSKSLEQSGFGSGICTTEENIKGKTVSITNFVLTKNGIISVRFQNGIKVYNSTLNVNNTGAKPIYLNGSPLTIEAVKDNVVVVLQYDDTNWNIIGSPVGLRSSEELMVDLGLPSGLKWATRNIDITQDSGFAASPYQYECSFFSWGNTDGHNPTSTSSFSPYNWGQSVNYAPYKVSTGHSLSGNIPLSQDAARVNLGEPWRIPTKDEFTELFNNVDYINPNGSTISSSTKNKLVTLYGIVGIYLKSKNNSNTIFFPASSSGGSNSSWNLRTTTSSALGGYSSSTYNSPSYAYGLHFNSYIILVIQIIIVLWVGIMDFLFDQSSNVKKISR